MAFKGGSPIQAGLGAANFSPILAGGQAMGNAYANVGATLASAGMQAMQTYQAKKQQKAQNEAANMFLQQNLNMAPDMSQNLVKTMGPQNAVMFGQQTMQAQAAQQQALRDGLAAVKAIQSVEPDPDTGLRDMGKVYGEFQRLGGINTTQLNEIIDNARPAGGDTYHIGEKPSTLQRSLDEKGAALYTEWVLSGGRTRLVSDIENFKGVAQKLEDGEVTTRTFVDFLPQVSDYARSVLNPSGQDAIDRIRGVAFQTLRETLGAQFTEREGQRLVESYFNPKLGEEENLQRLNRWINVNEQVVAGKDAAVQYMETNDTLKGFKGNYNWNVSEFGSALKTLGDDVKLNLPDGTDNPGINTGNMSTKEWLEANGIGGAQ